MTRRAVCLDALRRCHAEGLTIPETAARLGFAPATIYKLARAQGLRFANRKVPPPPITPEIEAARIAGYRSHFARRRATPVNGWTWDQLVDAGFTAPEAARVRGVTEWTAYAWAERHGRAFRKHHACPRRNPVAGLTAQEREDYARIKSLLHCDRAEALRILGRSDLIARMQRGDPLDELARRMAAEAERCNAAMRARDRAVAS